MHFARQQTPSFRCCHFQQFKFIPRAILACVIFFVIPNSLAQGNGITVGQPKVYDNQSLTIMLDELNARLNQVEAIDPQALAKALGLTQGSQQTDVSRSFDISVSLTPKAATSGSSETANSSSASSGSGSSSDKSNSSSSGSPSNGSALPDLLAAPSYKPDYGENAVDLLSDQVDLTYQIFNLRMMLERSVTDRLKDGSPRRQAVVSFNISLDPPANARDAAAYVELTLCTDQGPISLVASMPQEKTYNATSLSSSSTAFGGSAVAKIISVGYNQRKRSQTFFLYRDSDTLALERPSVGNSVTFGWVFRPVLGRRSVSPGMRQMFAVIALPETDLLGDGKTEAVGSPHVKVRAKTYWLHYDRNTATTVTRPGFWDWSAKKLPGSESPELPDIQPLPTDSIETALNPRIETVQVFQTTNGNTMLQIGGWNFFTGTTVTIGDKTFAGPQDGLFIKSSQTILLTASADVLSGALNAVVNGRYGPAVALYSHASPNGIVIAKSKLKPKGPNFSQIELIIGDADPTKDLNIADIQDFPNPILSLNGSQIPYRPALSSTSDKILDENTAHNYIVATVQVPNSLLHSRDNRAGVLFPLLGEKWSAEDLIYDADEVQVSRMTGGSDSTLLISRPGYEFNGNWRLVLDKTYPVTGPVTKASTPTPKPPPKGKPVAKKIVPPVEFSRVTACKDPNNSSDTNSCSMLKIVADSKFLSNYQKLILISDTGYAQILDVPATKPAAKETPAAPPKITGISPSTVGLNEVVTVTITGSGLDTVKQVTFEGKSLTFWAAPGKVKSTDAEPAASPDATPAKTSQIQVLLSRDVTGKEGRQELLLQVDAKNMSTVALMVAPAPTITKSPVNSPAKSPVKGPAKSPANDGKSAP
jgi:hypothetical protein